MRLRREGLRERRGPLRHAQHAERDRGHLSRDRFLDRGRESRGRTADGRDPEPRPQPELGQLQRGQRLLVRPHEDGLRRLDEGDPLPQRRAGLGYGTRADHARHAAADGADEPRLPVEDSDQRQPELGGRHRQHRRDGLRRLSWHDARRKQRHHGFHQYRAHRQHHLQLHRARQGRRRQRLDAQSGPQRHHRRRDGRSGVPGRCAGQDHQEWRALPGPLRILVRAPGTVRACQ